MRRPSASSPKRRAGTTRVSLTTRRSPGRRSDGRSATFLCPTAPLVRSSVMSRDVPRGAGRWAIDSGGRSKSKSETFTGGLWPQAADGEPGWR